MLACKRESSPYYSTIDFAGLRGEACFRILILCVFGKSGTTKFSELFSRDIVEDPSIIFI
jgi:hypothetical protein